MIDRYPVFVETRIRNASLGRFINERFINFLLFGIFLIYKSLSNSVYCIKLISHPHSPLSLLGVSAPFILYPPLSCTYY